MPETPDWAAAPQAVVTALYYGIAVIPAGTSQAIGVPALGRRYVIVGLDISATVGGNSYGDIRSVVTVDLIAAISGGQILSTAISPETPFVTVRPPFGSLLAAVDENLIIRGYGIARSGTQAIAAALYVYQQ